MFYVKKKIPILHLDIESKNIEVTIIKNRFINKSRRHLFKKIWLRPANSQVLETIVD